MEECLNYNACLKLDDTDFNATNPGVWVHRIHELKSLDKFTNWEQYKSDKPIQEDKMVKKIDLTDTSTETIDPSVSLADTNDSSIGPILNMLSQMDWKLWEMHNKSDRIDKMLAAVEDVKSLFRVHLMNDGTQSNSVEEVSGKPTSIICKLFKK